MADSPVGPHETQEKSPRSDEHGTSVPGAYEHQALPHAPPSNQLGYTRTMPQALFSRLSVRLSAGLAALFLVFCVAVCVAIMALWTSYGALEDCMTLTSAERDAASIGVAAREQYIHESHGIITRDPVHLGHDRQWATQLSDRVARLRPLVGERERRLLDSVQSNSTEMRRAFVEEVFPAALAGDLDRVRAGHTEVENLMEATVTASDRTAEHLAQKEVAQTSLALRRARFAGVTAGVTMLLAGVAAAFLAIVMIRSIVGPLEGLNLAAARIGEGDFNAVAPPTGAAEFEELRGGLGRMAAGLREREARLLKAERLAGLGALAAGVAHELNNPLGVILGYAKTLRKSSVAPEAAADLRIIEEEAQQCRRIVEDLVMFAREPRLERSSVEVAGLTRDVAARLTRSKDVGQHPIDVRGADKAVAWIDPTRIDQVLRNLLLNAAASSQNASPLEVEIEERPGQVTVKVRDSGAGIAAEDLPHLFEPFFSRRPGGTGLGLAVSHGIVLAHGGSIEIHSTPGKGTLVTVSLPKAPAEGA